MQKNNLIVINSKYFNDIFDAMIDIYIYIIAINNLLLQISCNNRLLFYKSYCNRLKIDNKKINLDQIIATISSL